MEFTPEKKARLRCRYDEAREKKEKAFMFEENEYLTAYAGYLLEYLDGEERRRLH
jgi:hypothetical protein